MNVYFGIGGDYKRAQNTVLDVNMMVSAFAVTGVRRGMGLNPYSPQME